MRPLAEVSRQSLDANFKPTSNACEPMKAKAYAIAVLGSYRSTDVDDPAVYAANAAAVLCRYPEPIVAEVCGPGTGIQTRLKWLPTVSELREACEQALGEQQARERRELLAKHHILIDTPFGPRPLEQTEKPTQEQRDRAVAHWGNEVRPHLAQAGREPRKNEPPPGLTDDQRREWYERRLEALKSQPTPMLSAEARKALGLADQKSEAA